MRTYADPTTCPSCGTRAAAAERCVRCAVLLRGADAQHVLRLLTDVDGTVHRMRHEADTWRFTRHTAPAAAGAPATGPAPAPTGPAQAGPGLPPMQPLPPREPRGWSVGNLLLGLGALCLVVAAAVFVSVSWDRMGLGGRTAVLGGITLVAAAVASFVTVHRLRGSADALWAVTAALVALDFWAARAFGLLGLDRLDDATAVTSFGVLLVATGAGVVAVSRRRLPSLLVGQITLLVATLALVGGVAALDDGSRTSWTLAVVVGGLVGLATLVLRLRVAAVGAFVATGLAFVALALAQLAALGAWAEAGPRWADPTPLWSLVVAALGLAPAAVTAAGPATWTRSRPALLALGTFLAVGQVVLVPFVVAASSPRVDDHVVAIAVVITAALVVVAGLARPRLGGASTGLRAAAAALALGAAGLLAAWWVVVVAASVVTVVPVWEGDLGTRMATTDGLGAWWSEPLLAGGLAVALLLASTWVRPETHLVTRFRPAAVAVAVAGAAVVSLVLPVPVVVPVGVAIVGAAALVVAGALRRSDVLLLIGTAALLPGVLLAAVAQSTSVIAWVAAAVVCAVATTSARGSAALAVPAGVGTLLGLAAVPAATTLLEAPERGTQLATLVAAVLTGLLAQAVVTLLPAASRSQRRVPVEGVAAVVGAVALLASIEQGAGWSAAMCTVGGAGLVLAGLVASDRRPVAVAGSLLLGLAYALRLVASDVTAVEAYTLPIGVLLLAAGVVAMRRRPALRTWAALTPGLLLALTPSLPQALADPTTLRGLLLTAGALAVVGVGAALRWQAPVVLGTTVAVVMVVRHLGPVADAVPRWALLAAAGVVLLAVGVTWEQRVRQARAAVLAVGSLR